MAINSSNVHAYGDITQRVFTAPLSATAPTSPLATAIPSGWYDIGLLDDASGLTEDQTINTTEKFGWQGSSLIRTLKTQAKRSFSFDAIEENAVTLGLLRPASTPVTTGATAEIQTITVTGTPAGGNMILTHALFGTITSLWNVPTATLAASLTAAIGGTVTVTGTPAVSYVITFPSSLGNVSTIQVTNTYTGGSSPNATIAESTPGVNGVTNWDVKPYTGLNVRQWAIYLTDGSVSKCLYVPTGEAISSGSPKYLAADLTVYNFAVNCYVDGTGRFYREISNNPAVGSGLFA